jgi:Galactose oxidase, central domain
MIYFLILHLVDSLHSSTFTSIPFSNSPPPVRAYHMMDYNKATGQIVIFGGSLSINVLYNDVWIFDVVQQTYSNLETTSISLPSNL